MGRGLGLVQLQRSEGGVVCGHPRLRWLFCPKKDAFLSHVLWDLTSVIPTLQEPASYQDTEKYNSNFLLQKKKKGQLISLNLFLKGEEELGGKGRTEADYCFLNGHLGVM